MEYLKEPGKKVFDSKVGKKDKDYLILIVTESYSQFLDKD